MASMIHPLIQRLYENTHCWYRWCTGNVHLRVHEGSKPTDLECLVVGKQVRRIRKNKINVACQQTGPESSGVLALSKLDIKTEYVG